jgi:RimJ/RimL family protein N-acetyltransferase
MRTDPDSQPSPRIVGPLLTTQRLDLRHLAACDAAFMLELLNDPSFIANIGDRGVRTVEDATRFIQDRMIPSYAQHGYGLYVVELRATGAAIGICGLVKRDYLDDPDIGFAFLPRFLGQGYALESATSVSALAFEVLRLPRLLAITSAHNTRSMHLLEKIGLRFERTIIPPGEAREIRLYTSDR